MSFRGPRPRILFFLPEGGAGGAEKIFCDIVAGFPADQAEILVATDPAIAQRIREKGGDGFEYLPWTVDGALDRPAKIPRDALRLRRILSGHAVTHLFAMKHYAACLGALATRLLTGRPRLILSFRGPAEPHISSLVPQLSRRLYLRTLVRLSAACADRILVPARGIGEDLVANFKVRPEAIAVIPNGIDLSAVERFSGPQAERWGLELERRYLLSVGRLAAEKRVEWVIDAFALLAPELPDHRLLILGEGPERDALERRARAAGIGERVTFIGYQQNVYPYLRRADVLLHSCEYEGLPNAIIEAMASETPVVATDCPFGPRELLGDDERGLLVPPRDPAALARAAQRLIADGGLRSRLVSAARRYVDGLTLGAMIARYRDLILYA